METVIFFKILLNYLPVCPMSRSK